MKILKTIWTERKRISEERLKVCGTCDKLEHDTYRCKACGCFMKAKSLFPDAKCPLDKWKQIQ